MLVNEKKRRTTSGREGPGDNSHRSSCSCSAVRVTAELEQGQLEGQAEAEEAEACLEQLLKDHPSGECRAVSGAAWLGEAGVRVRSACPTHLPCWGRTSELPEAGLRGAGVNEAQSLAPRSCSSAQYSQFTL